MSATDPWFKDPADADVWYEFDWSGTNEEGNSWLPTGTTISSYSIFPDSNLTKVGDRQQGSTVLIQVTGGIDDTQSIITNSITTSGGETFFTEKTIYIRTRLS